VGGRPLGCGSRPDRNSPCSRINILDKHAVTILSAAQNIPRGGRAADAPHSPFFCRIVLSYNMIWRDAWGAVWEGLLYFPQVGGRTLEVSEVIAAQLMQTTSVRARPGRSSAQASRFPQ
jgi:hypothetical protein